MVNGAALEFDVDGIPIRLSSPEKTYFPVLGEMGTKKAVFEYYRTVALGPMLPLVVSRPTYLQRFPDGIDGEEIYQKRLPGKHPGFIEGVDVTFPSQRTATVLRPKHAADICWAANLGTITFHTWPVTAPNVDAPDLLRIDVDPQPGTTYDDARDIAVTTLKPLLEELNVTGYAKTSGNKGIHVYVPITPTYDFVGVRRACIALAREMARRDSRVTTAWWKEERGERVFIDFNQNARDRTIAAPYSVRKTPTATVSTPLSWSELETTDPTSLTINTVPDLLSQRPCPWSHMHEHPGSLDALLAMAADDEKHGLGDMPYPPQYPKMPGEPKRVQPSKARHDG